MIIHSDTNVNPRTQMMFTDCLGKSPPLPRSDTSSDDACMADTYDAAFWKRVRDAHNYVAQTNASRSIMKMLRYHLEYGGDPDSAQLAEMSEKISWGK